MIRNEKPIVLFEKTAMRLRNHRPLPSARRCLSARLTRWWTRKKSFEKMEDRRGGEAQGVVDPPKNIFSINVFPSR
jgi:hypothetical protein